MKKIYTHYKFLFAIFLLLNSLAQAQVATTYTFSQASGTFTPLVANFPSTPANIFSTSWDDDSYTGYTLPFDFFYNGTLYPAGTVIGVDTDAWFAFNPGTMTGQLGGGSWVSASLSDGVYLYGTANNNGFAGINADHWYQNFTSITGNITSGSNVVTSVSSLTNIRVGVRLTGNSSIPDGTVVTAIGVNQFTMSANATATTTGASITPSASIFAMTRGTAPNRQFVVQWIGTKRFSGANNDNFSFQMILEEAPPQQLKVIYGQVSTDVTTDMLTQIGLRGASSADYNARTSSSNFNATTASTANTNTVALKRTNVPANGLTFIWSPVCPAMAAPGSITGVSPVCPSTTQTYSIPAVTGAGYYTWSYSGTGATFTTTTSTPSNNITFASNATGGTLSVTPANACVGAGTAVTRAITITAVTPASISYPSGSSYCTSNAPVSVTQTGPAGGTYSVLPSGLSINTSTGQITPASSTAGTYTVSYTYSNSGCASLVTTTSVTIKPIVAITATATPATVCGSGNAQLTAIADGGANYVVNAIAHNLLTPSGSPTVIWNTTTDDAVSTAVTLPFTFNYYGQSITQFTVSTNGFIEMGGTSGLSALTAQTIPNTTTPNNVIALSWRDLKLDITANPAANIRYFVNGTTPNRIMVVEYNGLGFYNVSSTTGNVTGQIRLYESDNHIEIHATVNDGGLNLSKTLGIENSSGTIGLSPSGHNNAVWNAITPEGWSFSLSNYTYSWSPATFLSNTAISNPIAVAINTTTNYTVTVTNTTTTCSNTANVNVLFANTQILSSNSAARCGTGSVALTATANIGNTINWYTASSGGSSVATGGTYTTPSLSATTTYYVAAEAVNAGATIAVGNGATTPSSYEGVFYHLFGGNQGQFLVRASELYAAGLRAGNITQLGIRFLAPNAATYNGFAISMMQTANTDMSAGINTGAFTGVYSAASYTPAAGTNTFTLSTAFNWNGTSNLIVKLCWSNNNSGGTSNYAQTDATAYVSCAYYRADSQTPATICGGTSATGTISARPQFYFTGTATSCSSARTAVTATINPQPSAVVMSPASASMCSSDAAVALSYTGGSYTISSTPYTQGFETFPASDFSASGSGITAATNTTYYAEGTKSVLVTYTSGLTTTSTNNAYQQTASVNLSTYSSATLNFKHICALEGPTTSYDVGYVQYSSNGGSSWTTFPTANYTGSGSLITSIGSPAVAATGTIFSTKSYADWTTQFSSSASTPGTGPAAALWKTETITIPAAALTNNFRIRFMVTSDGSVSYYGWLIDDIKITTSGTTGAPVTWSPTSGLYTNAGATVAYTGTAATTVYAKPTSTTTFTATSTAPGGCTSTNTVAVTVTPAYTWLGINSNWSSAANWCPGVPTTSNDVIINTGVPFMPTLSSGTGGVKNITMNAGATLTITGATMQIAGTISTATPGSINTTTGTIDLVGATAQAISGSSFTNRSIMNLKASNSVNISNTANDSLKITGVLSFGNVNSKVFNSGNNIILSSSANATAMVADITNNGVNSGNSFTGSFQVHRYIPARRAWRLMTAPIDAGIQTINQAWQEGVGGTWSSNPASGYGTHVTGGPARTTAQGFDQGPLNASIYGYTGTGWSYLPAATSELVTSRQGWMLFVRGSRAINLPLSTPATVADVTILRPTGSIKFGTQPTLTNTPGGYMVVGNPYPAPINFKNIGRTGVLGGLGGNNAYTLWDPALGGSSGVGAFVAFAWNGTNYSKSIVVGTGASSININGTIASSAAFMVNQDPNGTINIEEPDKDTTVYGNSYFFRPSAVISSLRMSLYGAETDGSLDINDGTLILFNPASSNDVNNEEVIKVNNVRENLAIYKAGQKVAIEFRNLLQANDTLYYRIWNMRQRHYEFEIALTDVEIPVGYFAWLEDTYLQQKTILSQSDTNRIAFDITADAATAAQDRFRIVIAPATVVPVTFTNVKAYEYNNDVMVEWTVQNELNIVSYEIEKSLDGINFTSIGNMLARGGNATYNSLDTDPATGYNYYRIKSIDNRGRTSYSQIVKVHFGKGGTSISIYPNPVTENIINVVFANMEQGTYQTSLYNSTGQLMLTEQIVHAGGNGSQSIRLNKTYAKGAYQLEVTGQDGARRSFKILVQ
jgi:hypothetical protein